MRSALRFVKRIYQREFFFLDPMKGAICSQVFGGFWLMITAGLPLSIYLGSPNLRWLALASVDDTHWQYARQLKSLARLDGEFG